MIKQACYLKALGFIALCFLPACSSAPKPKLPVQLQQAERHNIAGVAAEEKGSLQVADSEFIEAYRLFASVENYHGMVTALINSSRLYRRQGETEKAANMMKKAARFIPYSPELETELCFENCKLAVVSGDMDGAVLWAEKGVTSAKDPDLPRMLNLAAAVYLKKGGTQKCLETAGSALKSARSSGDRREEANALRLLGEVACMEKRYNDALQIYESALSIDKELAIAGRVYADLSALALAADALADVKKSADYLQRAVDAAIADRNNKGAAEKLERLITLYRRSGDSDSLEKTERLKDSLHKKSGE